MVQLASKISQSRKIEGRIFVAVSDKLFQHLRRRDAILLL